MVCPKCEAPMEKVAFSNVVVDRCTGCEGIWFDMLEHERLAQVRGSESIDTGSPNWGRAMDALGQIDCPNCRCRMIRLRAINDPQLWYEGCTVCYGVFFDAGEFKSYKNQRSQVVKTLLNELLSRRRRNLSA